MDHDLVVAGQDYQKLQRTHQAAGYRDGREEGAKAARPEAYRRGFREGVMSNVRWAKLAGKLSALELFLQQQGLTLTEELSEIKRETERVRAQGPGEGGCVSVEGDSCEERELWEVLESANPTDNLIKWEKIVDSAIQKLK